MTAKTSLLAAVAAMLASTVAVGSAIAPAQAQTVTLPVRTMVNA